MCIFAALKKRGVKLFISIEPGGLQNLKFIKSSLAFTLIKAGKIESYIKRKLYDFDGIQFQGNRKKMAEEMEAG